jgi:hypothetical protein
MTEAGDTIVFTVPRDKLRRLMSGGIALDSEDGYKLGLDIQEITPSFDDDTGEPDLTVTAIVTYVDKISGDEIKLG